ncbi:hypothetical protein LBMAG41_16670 [Cyanobium sp.]|nr:hypothetical protein LBMAG41_16670 [Cyanobium sp.]
MATTGSVSTKPLSPMTPCAQASAPARRRSSSEVVALGLATLVMGFLPAPQALATELPLVLSARGAAAVPASGQGVAAVQANKPVIAQAPGPAAEGGQGQNPPQGLRTKEASLAKQLANPVASLISVPFQFNYDSGIGVQENVQRANLNIQPVVPFKLSADWNLISRTILPVVNFQGEAGPETGQLNFGDTVQSLFLSPAKPGPGGVIWGVGPVALLPTATGQLSGIHQWGLGPTGVALVQRGPWTVGALANHLWSVANNGSNANVNATFLQPFLTYTTPTAWTISLNTESTYDWAANRWAVPLNLVVAKVTKVGNQLLSLGAGVRYWVDGPDSGPHGWGARLVATLLFPTR